VPRKHYKQCTKCVSKSLAFGSFLVRYTPGQPCLRVTSECIYHKMGSFCIYKQQKLISILCYGEFIESAFLHNIIFLSISVVYKCRRIPSYNLKSTLTSLSSKVDRESRSWRPKLRFAVSSWCHCRCQRQQSF